MRNRFSDFMSDRYGSDQLNRFLSILAIIVLVIGIITRIRYFDYIAIGLLVWCYFRIFSRNTSKRYVENEKFLEFTSRFRRRSGGNSYSRHESRASRARRREQNKYYRFFLCPHCRQKVRVPRGKGKIRITCPKCRTEFIKRT